MAPLPEPQPAALPLPGGRQGATVRVHPLLCGLAAWPESWPHRQDGRFAKLRSIGAGVPRKRWIPIPIVAFLVEHPAAGPILIDTGLEPAVAEHPRHSFGRILAATGGRTFTMDASQAVPAQLRARGVNPADVKVIVMTHLHYDHASGMAQFPNSTFLITKWEWDAANGPFSLLHGYVRRHFVRDVDYRLLDFEGRGAESYATFGRTLDLFGDGSVRLLPTPGHTHGHISVILRTSSLEILVAGDATYTRHTLETGHRPARVEDERMYTRSLRGLQIYHRERPDSLVIPGHDLEAWRELAPVYE